jgi:hypothetical protein
MTESWLQKGNLVQPGIATPRKKFTIQKNVERRENYEDGFVQSFRLLKKPQWVQWKGTVGLLVDKYDLINYQFLIIYGLLLRIFTYQPTVDKTILISTNC